jgi:hypothetical protein
MISKEDVLKEIENEKRKFRSKVVIGFIGYLIVIYSIIIYCIDRFSVMEHILNFVLVLVGVSVIFGIIFSACRKDRDDEIARIVGRYIRSKIVTTPLP